MKIFNFKRISLRFTANRQALMGYKWNVIAYTNGGKYSPEQCIGSLRQKEGWRRLKKYW